MVQVPTAIKLAVVPDTAQVLRVAEEKLTGKPELAAAERMRGVPTIWAEIVPKVMVCASPLTVKLCETGLAAA